MAIRDFELEEIVWAKIRGFVHWPAKIVAILPNGKYEVVWFNDYRRTNLFKTQLFKFIANFESYAKNFDKKIGLRTAAMEAMIIYGQRMNK